MTGAWGCGPELQHRGFAHKTSGRHRENGQILARETARPPCYRGLVLYVDDKAALAVWRHGPDALVNAVQCCEFAAPHARCPATKRAFDLELTFLPPLNTTWHFMVPTAQLRLRRSTYGYTTCTRRMPAHAFVQLNEHVCVAMPELVFLQMAKRLPLPLLVKLGDELCGTYTMLESDGVPVNRREPLCSRRSIAEFLREAHALDGARAAQRAARFLVEGAASVKEAELEMLLCLPTWLGGYGLPAPTMNARVDFDAAAMRLARRAYARCDLCWPEHMLDVEYDGRTWHAGFEGAARDKARLNALQSMGFHVIAVSSNELHDPAAFESLACDIASALHYRMRSRMPDSADRHRNLQAALLASATHPLFQTCSAT